MKQFFLVWNPAGSNPQCRHSTPEEATREARRLASVSRGQTFFVLAAVSASTHDPVKTERLEVDASGDELPF